MHEHIGWMILLTICIHSGRMLGRCGQFGGYGHKSQAAPATPVKRKRLGLKLEVQFETLRKILSPIERDTVNGLNKSSI